MGWVVNATPLPLYHWELRSTHFIQGWVGTRDGLKGVQNLAHTEI